MNLKKIKFSPAARRWVYGVGIAAAPLLVIYGIVGKEEVALWLGALYAILGFSLATGNVNDD
jgi:hypothetical protein